MTVQPVPGAGRVGPGPRATRRRAGDSVSGAAAPQPVPILASWELCAPSIKFRRVRSHRSPAPVQAAGPTIPELASSGFVLQVRGTSPCAGQPLASATHFLTKLVFAAPASFLLDAWTSQLEAAAAFASDSHFFVNDALAAPASFFCAACASQDSAPTAKFVIATMDNATRIDRFMEGSRQWCPANPSPKSWRAVGRELFRA